MQVRALSAFPGNCDATVEHFLASKLPAGQSVTEPQRSACLEYIGAELPFFPDTPGILGVPTSVSCYHLVLPLTELLDAKRGGPRAARNQAYAVVQPNAYGRTADDDRQAA